MGMEPTILAHRPIREVLVRARTGWSGAASGAAAMTTAAASRSATTATTRPARSTASASVLLAVQSPQSSRSGANGTEPAQRGTSGEGEVKGAERGEGCRFKLAGPAECGGGAALDQLRAELLAPEDVTASPAVLADGCGVLAAERLMVLLFLNDLLLQCFVALIFTESLTSHPSENRRRNKQPRHGVHGFRIGTSSGKSSVLRVTRVSWCWRAVAAMRLSIAGSLRPAR